jgi:hypothetical protein
MPPNGARRSLMKKQFTHMVQAPVKYMTLFGQLAHAHGLKVIQAPALDLATVPGSVLPRHRGESVNQWNAGREREGPGVLRGLDDVLEVGPGPLPTSTRTNTPCGSGGPVPVSYWSPERTDVMRCVLKPSQCIRPT